MLLSGISPDSRLVEIVELRDHPWFVASQFHPEFKSRPERPHPLFHGFVATAIALRDGRGAAAPAVGRAPALRRIDAPERRDDGRRRPPGQLRDRRTRPRGARRAADRPGPAPAPRRPCLSRKRRYVTARDSHVDVQALRHVSDLFATPTRPRATASRFRAHNGPGASHRAPARSRPVRTPPLEVRPSPCRMAPTSARAATAGHAVAPSPPTACPSPSRTR